MTSPHGRMPYQADDYDPLSHLLEVLDLRAAADDPDLAHDASPGLGQGRDDATYTTFVARSQPQPHGRVYGGQVVAQAVIAAGRTVATLDGPTRVLHSLHGYFLRPGDSSSPIGFVVEVLRDGSSFSARRVHAIQQGKPILSMACSFQTAAEGLDHQDAMPSAPDPSWLPTVEQELAGLTSPRAEYLTRGRPIDVRHCQGGIYVTQGRQAAAEQSVWIRPLGTLPDDPLVHAAVLAYASDYTLLEAVLRRHRIVWADPRLRPASLDHAMWFHRPARADAWILYTQVSPSASSGRGLGIGKMFAEDGGHIATVAQEGMLRLKGYSSGDPGDPGGATPRI
ncbi:MAG TPA: acyl-CoA thioesterase II [Dermatophilaceae bacterium]|nr:acyl-CoA thioesterase II [Dermatophilaceae bacterium]